MSDEERRDSLADQAAAWVPPWERPRPPAPTAAPAEAESSDAAAGELVVPAESIEAGEPTEAAEPADVDEPVVPAEAVVPEAGVAAVAGEPAAAGAARGVPRREPVGRRRPAVVPEPAPELPDAELRGALEAILLVVDEPVSEMVLAQVLEQPAERIGPVLDEIAAGYAAAGNGFELRRAAGGWRLYTRPEYATYVERFVLDGQSVRLTQAALETLAVVAYKQPVTRSRISAIRGVNCDGVIRTLVTRGLVEECGTESDSGAFLYRTTTLFLEKLGLNTVDELPPLAPFLPDDVEELADATR
ncbi:SMC-Scp complex subunit ScpB [Micromonospora sp. NPDC005979]|uniref:SMC-Scp complex subunit ScpB n=1 Tax=Micromonospora sp. NPDC005979 TaxID=3156726 RepID=UPI0033B482C9